MAVQTEKLYYVNQYLREFDAQVESCAQTAGGFAVVLSRTAFYPEGGGQSCDLGTLGGAQVLDVQEQDGRIVHLCSAALPVGQAVHGAIDWARRFDLMQQHSGEHLVSGLIHSRFGYDNVGFHMGADMITIDFNGMLNMQQLQEIEAAANDAVWRNLTAEIFYPDRETLHTLPYRSKKELIGQVRLVRYPDVDLCACCGTHVKMTGEIGLIKLLSCVKFHDGVRVEMLCGKRALDYLSAMAGQNREISGLLSAKPMETAQEARRVLEELNRIKYQLTGCEERLLALKAAAFCSMGNVLHFEDGLRPDEIRKLAAAGMEQCGGVCAVFSGSDGAGYQYAMGQAGGDLRSLVKQMNAALHGRGGGKPFFAQGAVSAERAAIERFFADCWNSGV